MRRLVAVAVAAALLGAIVGAEMNPQRSSASPRSETTTTVCCASAQVVTPDGAVSPSSPWKGWEPTSTGVVYAYNETSYGDLPLDGVSVSDIIGITPTLDRGGYWLLGSDGGVFAFGDAHYYGSMPGIGGVPPADGGRAIGLQPCTNGGYRVVVANGSSFPFDCGL